MKEHLILRNGVANCLFPSQVTLRDGVRKGRANDHFHLGGIFNFYHKFCIIASSPRTLVVKILRLTTGFLRSSKCKKIRFLQMVSQVTNYA